MTGVRMLFAALVMGITALPAAAQQPSKEQTDAVRSNCRSDFMSKCMSVKPGGIEAIQCLKKNDASLSGGCRAAVSAIKLPGEAPAAPAAAKPAAPVPAPAAAAPAPAPTAPPAAAAAPAPAPAPATSAPKPATAAAPAAPTSPKPAAAPKPAVAAVPPAAAAPAPAPAPAVSPQPKPTLQEAALVRRFCTVDYQVLCKGVRIGGGRVIKCLAGNQPALSPGCKAALANAM